jgi:hypothetical protein
MGVLIYMGAGELPYVFSKVWRLAVVCIDRTSCLLI